MKNIEGGYRNDVPRSRAKWSLSKQDAGFQAENTKCDAEIKPCHSEYRYSVNAQPEFSCNPASDQPTSEIKPTPILSNLHTEASSSGAGSRASQSQSRVHQSGAVTSSKLSINRPQSINKRDNQNCQPQGKQKRTKSKLRYDRLCARKEDVKQKLNINIANVKEQPPHAKLARDSQQTMDYQNGTTLDSRKTREDHEPPAQCDSQSHARYKVNSNQRDFEATQGAEHHVRNKPASKGISDTIDRKVCNQIGVKRIRGEDRACTAAATRQIGLPRSVALQQARICSKGDQNTESAKASSKKQRLICLQSENSDLQRGQDEQSMVQVGAGVGVSIISEEVYVEDTDTANGSFKYEKKQIMTQFKQGGKASSLKNHSFVYGNYRRYYGYRHVQAFHSDNRLNVLQKEWFYKKRCLDVGCNSGVVTLAIASQFRTSLVTGVDIDAALIRQASSLLHKTRSEATQKLQTHHTMGPNGARKLGALRTTVSSLRHVQFVCQDWTVGRGVGESYDVVLLLSITKWMQFHHGDEGLKQIFKKVKHVLSPGGVLVLEPQPWESYKKARKKKGMSEVAYPNLEDFQFRPEHFSAYLTDTLGFVQLVDTSSQASGSGFNRPMQVFLKPRISQNTNEVVS